MIEIIFLGTFASFTVKIVLLPGMLRAVAMVLMTATAKSSRLYLSREFSGI